MWQALRIKQATERMNEFNQRGSGKVTPKPVQTSLYFCSCTSPKFIKDRLRFYCLEEGKKTEKKNVPFYECPETFCNEWNSNYLAQYQLCKLF